jgi:hypothetical protein
MATRYYLVWSNVSLTIKGLMNNFHNRDNEVAEQLNSGGQYRKIFMIPFGVT